MANAMNRTAVTEFVARACSRHGGSQAFNRIDRLELQILGLRGFLPRLKGLGWTFPSPSAVDVWPHRQRAAFFDYPQRGSVGIYESGRAAIGPTATDVADGPSHRRSFGPLSKWRFWTPQDAVYFFGYSLVEYTSLPFCLVHHELIEARRNATGVELWYRFPSGSDTHSAIQGFYFDASGLLLRHDYRAEILGRIFNGAHLHREHRMIGGILLATRRTVYVKPWHYPVRRMLPIPVLDARLTVKNEAVKRRLVFRT
jgi:hypothetical protein